MNAKKAGLITAGVVAALVAASPLAWAVGPSAQAPDPCTFTAQGTDGTQEGSIVDDNPINLVSQAPVGGNNVGHYGECSTFNNNNGEGNGEGNVFIPPFGLPTFGTPSNN